MVPWDLVTLFNDVSYVKITGLKPETTIHYTFYSSLSLILCHLHQKYVKSFGSFCCSKQVCDLNFIPHYFEKQRIKPQSALHCYVPDHLQLKNAPGPQHSQYDNHFGKENYIQFAWVYFFTYLAEGYNWLHLFVCASVAFPCPRNNTWQIWSRININASWKTPGWHWQWMKYIITDLVYISSGRHVCKIGEAHIKGWEEDCRNSSALVMTLRFSRIDIMILISLHFRGYVFVSVPWVHTLKHWKWYDRS